MRTKGFIDIHCHILPGVDDGARSISEAERMLDIAYADGIRSAVLTPHFFPDRFENSKERLLEEISKLREFTKEFPEPFGLSLGCEVFACSDALEQLMDEKIPTMADTRYVLVEFPVRIDLKSMLSYVHTLLMSGFWPIVAHDERYEAVHVHRDGVGQLIDLGAYIQVNASDLSGEHGFKMKRFCRRLLREDQLHFIGTDAHRATHRKPELRLCYERVAKWCGKARAEQLFIKNPTAMLDGKRIEY